MEKYAILLGYFDKQLVYIKKLYDESIKVDLSNYAERYVFALKVQKCYTTLEDLFKQIAKSFENHIENMSNFHSELLSRMNMEVPKIRPQVISQESLLLLDKIRAFRHFIRHAYNCELDPSELLLIQNRLKKEYANVESDLPKFRSFIQDLSNK